MSNQARHGDDGRPFDYVAYIEREGRREARLARSERAAMRHERHATEAERAAERRADESEAALRRSVSRVKLKLAVAAARIVEMPCGHTVPSNPLRPDWCSACERLTGGVE